MAERQYTFDAMKEALSPEPILISSDFRRPFIAQMDMTKIGPGAVAKRACEELHILY